MKLVEITPRRKLPLYGALIRREADIRSKGRGTFARQGRTRARSAIWKHKRFKGTVNLQREGTEQISAKIRSSTPEDEGSLLKAFLGFIDRHCGNQVETITIHYQ
jgi:hypothetical protein